MEKKMIKVIIICLLLCIAVIGFSGGQRGTGKATYTIAYIPKTLNNEHYVIQVEGAKKEAEKLGVELIVQAAERHGSVDEQLQILERMIAREVDAICLVVGSATGMISPVEKALDAGVMIVTVDNGLDADAWAKTGRDPVPFIGSNNYDGAKMVGEYALDTLNMKGKKVALLTGIPGQSAAIERRGGFMDTVEGKVDLVAEQTADWEVEKGYTVFQNILQANPGVDFLFACNDNMALGAARAAQEGGSGVKIIGYDAIPSALEAIKEGKMYGTIAQYPAIMGSTAVDYAVKMLKGESVPEITYTKLEVITKDKVEEFKEYLSQFTVQ